jgi:O-antigen biosynthesis protein
MVKKPKVSIIIVNFNGRHLLDECLQSVRQLDFPQSQYEVILVDNNSSDDSVPYVRSHYPWVNVVISDRNLGFTGGNNLGFQHATGEYIVLLNNDVRADKNWLKELVKAAQPADVGLVSSRLRYAIPFLELAIQSQAVPKSQISVGIDHSPVGVLIEDIVCEDGLSSNLVWYKNGFYDKKMSEVITRRTNGNAKVLLPFDQRQTSHVYKITFHGLETNEMLTIPVELTIGGKVVFKTILRPYQVKQVDLVLKRSTVQKHFIWLIQNAGNIVLRTGYGKDRGSLLMYRENEVREGYEEENPYFLQPTELLSACGASCLIKRAVINHVGFLDGHYFMYYEDVEFSLRAWRAGWKIAYAPESLGYHRHRATTGGEETAFFLEHVERNHMLFVISHFPLSTVISELFLFTIRFMITMLKSFIFQFNENEGRSREWRIKFCGRKAAFMYVVRSFPRLIYARIKLAQYWPIDHKKLFNKTY